MQRPCGKDILEFHTNTIDEVRALYGLDRPGEMDNAVDILEEWVKKQHHFIKKDFGRAQLEFTIISCKGSIEKAKARLDRRCTYKTIMPKFFRNFDMKKEFEEFVEFGGSLNFSVIRKLTRNNERIVMMRCSKQNPTGKFLFQAFRIAFMVCEFLIDHPDYASSFIIICDVMELNLGAVLNTLNITELREAVTILMDAYGIRIHAVHFLSKSKLTEKVVFIAKLIKEKLSKKFHIHRSIESLHNFLPKDLIPNDYGGIIKNRSLEEQHEDWLEALSTEEFQAHLSDVSGPGTDESLRDSETFNKLYDYLGTHGTFRSLNVD